MPRTLAAAVDWRDAIASPGSEVDWRDAVVGSSPPGPSASCGCGCGGCGACGGEQSRTPAYLPLPGGLRRPPPLRVPGLVPQSPAQRGEPWEMGARAPRPVPGAPPSQHLGPTMVPGTDPRARHRGAADLKRYRPHDEASTAAASSSVKGHARQRKLPFQPTLSRVGAGAPIDGVGAERVPIHSGTITHEDPPTGLNCPIVRHLEDAQQRCAQGIYDDLQAAYSPPNPADYGSRTHWETCRDLAGELTNLNLVWLSDYPNRLQSECGVDWETAIGIAQRSFGPDVTYCPGVTYPDSDLDIIARNRHQGGWHPPDGVWAEGCSATIDPRYEVDVRRAILWSYLRRLGLHERPRACLYPECPDPNRSVCEACCDFNGGGGECKADCCGGLR